jgi:dipeptidyl aminopeptidase/acylaminoacyl peptidase
MRRILTLCVLIATVPTPAASATIHQFSDLALAPQGDHTATVENEDPGNLPDEPHARIVVRGPDGKVFLNLDPCRTCRYANPAFSSRGELVFLATDEKKGQTTLYHVPNGVPRPLTVIAGLANTVRFSPDGSRIALLVTLGAKKRPGATEAGAPQVGEIGETNDEQRIAVLPAGGGQLKPVSPADTYIYEFSWTPDGNGFVATAAKGNGDNNWWVASLDYVDVATSTLRVIAKSNMQMDMPRVSADGTVALIGGLMSDWGPIGGDIYTVPVSGGVLVDITPGFQGTFTGLDWRGKILLTTALMDDQAAIIALDPKTKAKRQLWSSPVSVKSQNFDNPIALSADGSRAATLQEGFTHGTEIARGPLSILAPVTHANATLPANVSFQSVHWKNDGVSVQGWLLEPRQLAPGKHPMLMIIHGGPSSAATPHYVADGGQHGMGFDFIMPMIKRGYLIFYPNPRGSYGQGEAFTRANIRDFGRGDLKDDLAGVDAVEKIAPVDEKRLGLYGHSYGGWMSMWANTQTHRFKAIVAGAGIADWESYYGQNGIDQWMIPFFGASVYDDPGIYRAASPITFIKNAKTPILIYVGERDVECPAPQSLEYWHALNALHVPSTLVIYAGEGHRFHKLSDLEDLRKRFVAWFDAYLKT